MRPIDAIQRKFDYQKLQALQGGRRRPKRTWIETSRNDLKTIDQVIRLLLIEFNKNVRFMQLTPVNWDYGLMMIITMLFER